jgi:hypothetical protein
VTDDEFLVAVERTAEGLPPSGFHFGHPEHMRLAWLQHERGDDVTAATLRRIDAAHGGAHYHETITRFWLGLVRHARVLVPCQSFDAVLAGHPQLLEGTTLLRHYSRTLLASDRARSYFVPPDLAPLPWEAGPAVDR